MVFKPFSVKKDDFFSGCNTHCMAVHVVYCMKIVYNIKMCKKWELDKELMLSHCVESALSISWPRDLQFTEKKYMFKKG